MKRALGTLLALALTAGAGTLAGCQDETDGGAAVSGRDLKERSDAVGPALFAGLARDLGGTLRPMEAEFGSCAVSPQMEYGARSQVAGVDADADEVVAAAERALEDAGFTTSRREGAVTGRDGELGVSVSTRTNTDGPVRVVSLSFGTRCRTLSDRDWAERQPPVDWSR